MGDGGQDQLGEVGRPLAADRVDRLAQLEGVPHRAAERLVHVREQADDLAPGALSELDHRLGELPGVVERLHEGAVADLDVEDDRVGAAGELLGHDAGGDERDVVDRRRHVSKGVELLVGGNEVRGLADDRQADLPDLGHELLGRQLGAVAGNRLELVDRPSRVTEPAAAHLAERDAAGGDDRADGDRGLVAHSSGGVLVDALAAEGRAQIDRLAARDHRVGERERLGARQPLEVHGHQKGGHLVVGHLATGVAEHELAQLVGGQLVAVALALDQLRGSDRHGSHTNTTTWRVASSGPSKGGRRSAR